MMASFGFITGSFFVLPVPHAGEFDMKQGLNIEWPANVNVIGSSQSTIYRTMALRFFLSFFLIIKNVV